MFRSFFFVSAIAALMLSPPASAQRQASADRPSDLIGANVVGPDQRLLGVVDDIARDQAGKPQSLIVGLAGYLGLGEKDVAVPIASMEVLPGERKPLRAWDGKYGGTNPSRVMVRVGVHELAGAPAYQAGETGKPAVNSGSPTEKPKQQPPSSTQSGGPG